MLGAALRFFWRLWDSVTTQSSHSPFSWLKASEDMVFPPLLVWRLPSPHQGNYIERRGRRAPSPHRLNKESPRSTPRTRQPSCATPAVCSVRGAPRQLLLKFGWMQNCPLFKEEQITLGSPVSHSRQEPKEIKKLGATSHLFSAPRKRPGAKTAAAAFPFMVPMRRWPRSSAKLLLPMVSKSLLTQETNHLSLNPNSEGDSWVVGLRTLK